MTETNQIEEVDISKGNSRKNDYVSSETVIISKL